MKVYGENVILGGSEGFVGIGVLGKATGIRGNWAAPHRKAWTHSMFSPLISSSWQGNV